MHAAAREVFAAAVSHRHDADAGFRQLVASVAMRACACKRRVCVQCVCVLIEPILDTFTTFSNFIGVLTTKRPDALQQICFWPKHGDCHVISYLERPSDMPSSGRTNT
ncbi:hypothetical protein AVEN_120368-1 [Araneus ventricosus]|uniref:Uncharacterized protein n=1 Tax=Araneus ventricosus TaxID=182803 RepID=A0A4Y2RIZ9_ARAVE|nr:hypothetical protein AVEN_120368-1 [Araneus ventricosus]